MGARFYICWLGRWLSPDPINSENYNLQKGYGLEKNKERDFLELTASPYEYCYDNPIVYNDPSGEQPPFQSNFNFGIGLVLGTHNMGIRLNTSYTQKAYNWELSTGGSATYYASFSNTGKKGFEFRASVLGGFNDNHSSFTLGRNWFWGTGGMSEFKQSTGIMNIGIGKFRASYENDGFPFNTGKDNNGVPWLSDGYDSYRTASVRLSYDKFSMGVQSFHWAEKEL